MSATPATNAKPPVVSAGAGALPRRRAVLAAFVAGLGIVAAALTALHIAVIQLPVVSHPTSNDVSVTVVDRDDRLLRAFTTASGHWRLPVTPDQVDPRYLAMLTAFEDQRFYSHGGVDLQAATRAVFQLIRHGRIVSGGSTLTMQTARLIEGPQPKSGVTKLRQTIRALQLERKLGKRDILSLYLLLAPFGGNMEGVRAASIAYFGKEPKRLSIGEAALLVAIPQSPQARRPDRFPNAAQHARNRVLARAFAVGIINRAELTRAMAEPIPHVRRDFPKLAPHLADAERTRAPLRAIHATTLDRDLQRTLEDLTREHTRTLGEKLSAAVLVIDHKSGQVLAHVGSAGYLDDARFGAIDMVNAVRSPGSTLKPIIFGLGFEAGLAHPEMLIEDRAVRFGTYSPKNFDEEFHGTVSVREALSQSLNIPAVKMLNAVGPGRLVGRFMRFGIAPVLPARSEPTIAIALGGIGLTLHDLATMYASLARGGEAVSLSQLRQPHLRQPGPRPGAMPAIGPASLAASTQIAARRRLLTSVAAWYVTDILKDQPPPVSARGGRIAYKTGTSYGYRDAYAIGYDGAHTIAVWVGRPDSAATAGLTGRTAAAPLLFDAFARVGEARAPLAAPPSGAVVVAAAQLPQPLKRFKEPGEDLGSPTGPYLDAAPAIAFPPDRSDIEIDGADGASVVIKADGGTLPFTWLADGAPIPSEPFRRDVSWEPTGRGFVKLSVIDANGKVDRVTVRVR